MIKIVPKPGKGAFGANQCMHMKLDGVQCRQTAMRNQKYCHFHNFLYERDRMPGAERFRLPIAENTASIQACIIPIMRALTHNAIDNKTAGQLLWALQLSSTNLLCPDREVFPPPPPKEEQAPNLAQFLLAKLRDEDTSSFTEAEHQYAFNQPHPNPPPAKPAASAQLPGSTEKIAMNEAKQP